MMKRNITLITKVLSLAIVACVSFNLNAQTTYCPASPDAVTFQQPDGTPITVVGKGNALIGYSETEDGYTLVRTDKGYYEYAVVGVNGDLVSSHIKASNSTARSVSDLRALAGIGKHVRMSENKVQEIVQKATLSNGKQARKSAARNYFPSKGNRKVLMLLIEYPDLLHKSTNDDSAFIKLMNQPNYQGTGSFRDYYLSNSTGQLDMNVDVFGWFVSSQSYKAYGRSAGGDGAADPLVREAIDSAAAHGVDFAKYDNDSDGMVDGLLIVHAGQGAEVGGGNNSPYIWSHQGELSYSGLATTYNNVSLDHYMIQPELYLGSTMSGIGVFCHEFGHILGLPDLYDIDYSSQGIGDWSIMAGGPYLNNTRTPACFDAWCKIDLKWNKPVILDLAKGGVDSLHASSITQEVFEVRTPVSSEYFLLENRQNKAYDKFIPGHGLAIWHIDSLKAGVFRKNGSNSVNSTDAHRGVDLEQADGKNDLSGKTSQGDPSDLFPYKAQYTVFSDTTAPPAFTYGKAPGATTTKTGVVISDIVERGGVIYFGYSLASPSAGINNKMILSANVYPNPASDKLFVNIEAQNASAELVDISGRVLMNTTLNSGKNELNTNNLGKGVYILKLSTPDGKSRMEKVTLVK